MSELKSGFIQELTVIRQEGSRWVMDGNGEEVLMNVSDADAVIQVGDSADVFLYANRRGELTATMNMPNMTAETFGWATVIRIDEDEGVYVDIGSSFEVLVNRADMPQVRSLWPRQGDALYMTLRTDLGGQIFGRLATEERVMEHYTKAEPTLFNENLKARAYRLLPIGSFMISVPDNYRVFIHNTEQEKEPRLGQEVNVRVIDVHDDGTLNGSMLPRVEDRMTGDAATIYNYLVDADGEMSFTDKSSPAEIQEAFGMSKGSFKRAIGRLMKERKVTQEDGVTKLAE